MIFNRKIPEDLLGKVALLEELLIESGSVTFSEHNNMYIRLRNDLINDKSVRQYVPQSIKKAHSLNAFIADIGGGVFLDAVQKEKIREDMVPLYLFLDGENYAPSDGVVAEAIEEWDVPHVKERWQNALDRRNSDLPGAITSARGLLEDTLKQILYEKGNEKYKKTGMNDLWDAVTDELNLAPMASPSGDIESALAKIAASGSQMMENASIMAENLGKLRNSSMGDSHGKSADKPGPEHRHATLAVNTAGALAAFLIETHLETKGKQND